MKKTVYLHIGAHKTGTTALQLFLSHNRKILENNGYLYPGRNVAHHDMAREFQLLTLQEITTDPRTATNKYFDEINNSNSEKIILSAEKFENLGPHINKLKEFLLPRFLVKIIFYLMCQDEQIESMFNASIKNPDHRSKKTFSEFITNKSGVNQNNSPEILLSCKRIAELDYYSALRPWKDAFGEGNIFVRVNEHEQLPMGIFHDFLSVLGLQINENYWIPEKRINKSLNWDLIEVIRLGNIHFGNDRNYHAFLLNNLTQINSENKEGKQRLLSPQQRRDIISLFKEANMKVAREYLGRSDGKLFYAPLPDLDEPWKPFEGLTVEKIVPIFTQMLFNLDMRIEKRKNSRLKRRMMMIIKKIGTWFGLSPAMEYVYHRFYCS